MNVGWDLPATMGGGFFVGILIGYAIKKVLKIVAIIVGLFLAALAYLQNQQIINVNWAKFQTIAESTLTTLANSTTQIPGFSNGSSHSTFLSGIGLPLTGSVAMGVAIGFIKG